MSHVRICKDRYNDMLFLYQCMCSKWSMQDFSAHNVVYSIDLAQGQETGASTQHTFPVILFAFVM